MLDKCIITGFADEIDASFDVQLRVLNEIGQNYIELRSADGVGIADFDMEKAKVIKSKMDANGIKVSAIGSPIGKIDITDDFDNHFEKYKHIVELAHHFETDYIRMFSFYLPGDKPADDFFDEVIDRTGKLVDYAKSEGVVLLHENEKGIYGACARECKKLMDVFYGDNYKAIFDFANFIQCDQDTLEAYEILKDYIAYIHVKDALSYTHEVVLPGTGAGHLADIFSALDKKGFDGFLSLEPHLFNFVGLDRLEQGEIEVKKESNGIQAYKAAHNSLINLLV